jgi:hypothetical protein
MEQWRDIPGYEGRYRVSSEGRVLSLKGRPKLLRPGLRSGYPSVVLAVDRVKVNRTVHALVLLAFVGPRPDGAECLHCDGNRLNNHLSNLRYGAHAENQRDMVLHGRSLQGVKHHKAKLTEEQVRAIRADWRGATRLSKIYPVSRTTIEHIKSGKIWRHLLPGGV